MARRCILNENMKHFKLTLLFGALCLIACEPSKSQTPSREHYKDSLRLMVKLLKEKREPAESEIQYVIPETEDEAIAFFAVDYEKGNSEEFRKLQAVIDGYCIKGNKSIFKKYLLYSEFVDGYIAEDYFDSIEKIISVQKGLFCELFKTLPKERISRLRELFEANCTK